VKRLFQFKTALLALAAMVLLVAITACGDDDSDNEGEVAGASSGATATSPAASSNQAAQAATATPAEDPRSGWPSTFRIGFFGGDDAEETLKKQEPFRQYLEAQLGMKVELFTGTSYNAVIEAMRADRVDAMLVGPFSYILAVQEADAEALAVYVSTQADPPVYDAGIKPSYNSVIFTKKGNGINSIEDIRGKGFNFVDPASTSGHLAPKTLLIQRGYDPDQDFQTVFAGSHPTSVISVWNDKAVAGATNEGNLARLVSEGQIEWCAYPDGEINKVRTQEEIDALFESCEDGKIVVLAQTDPIPSTPFAIRTEMPESFKTAVKELLLDLKDNPGFISEAKYWFVDPHEEYGLETLDQYYNVLRDIARLLDLNLKELES